jgi:hypothetical protein
MYSCKRSNLIVQKRKISWITTLDDTLHHIHIQYICIYIYPTRSVTSSGVNT